MPGQSEKLLDFPRIPFKCGWVWKWGYEWLKNLNTFGRVSTSSHIISVPLSPKDHTASWEESMHCVNKSRAPESENSGAASPCLLPLLRLRWHCQRLWAAGTARYTILPHQGESERSTAVPASAHTGLQRRGLSASRRRLCFPWPGATIASQHVAFHVGFPSWEEVRT